MNLVGQVKQKIQKELPGSEVTVIDQSHDHIEHNPTGAHIGVKVKYKGFEGKSELERHQMIYPILKEELKQKIHALAIKTEV
ncbi:MAG TPA: BolA family protein [Candidatus Nanoarchaeia archaeon]|nr:BolA family protein [Candidatus Nanoarchaeia archaeon]